MGVALAFVTQGRIAQSLGDRERALSAFDETVTRCMNVTSSANRAAVTNPAELHNLLASGSEPSARAIVFAWPPDPSDTTADLWRNLWRNLISRGRLGMIQIP